MNKERRKVIEDITRRLDEAKSILEALRDELDEPKGEERDYYDSMPESLQQGEKGSAAEQAADALDAAYDNIDTAINDLDEAFGNLEQAVSG